MPLAEADWQVYDTDAVERALVQILTGFSIKAYPKRSTLKRSTPCVELSLETQGVQGKRFKRFETMGSGSDLIQPYNTWTFNLKCTVITERSENGEQHGKICGQVRAYLQYGWLTVTFTPTVSPYHAITEIREAISIPATVPDDNLDATEITFTGMLNVRDNAWPAELT